MTREIKFRGFYHKKKDVLYPEVKKWVYGSLEIRDDGTCWIMDGGVIVFIGWQNEQSEYYFLGAYECPIKEWEIELMETIGTIYENKELLEKK